MVKRLVERGYSVVALSRDPDKAREAFGRPPKDGPLTVATADVTDPEALAGPMQGCVACVSCVYVFVWGYMGAWVQCAEPYPLPHHQNRKTNTAARAASPNQRTSSWPCSRPSCPPSASTQKTTRTS